MKTPILRIALMLCALILSQSNFAQSCAVSDNLEQLNTNEIRDGNSFNHGQSFTATCNGTIQSIRVYTDEVTQAISGQLKFFNEVPFTGSNQNFTPINGTNGQAINWSTSSSETAQTIELATPLTVTAGEDYTFIIEGTIGSASYRNVDSFDDSSLDYSGGFLYSKSGNTWIRDTARDLKFEVHYTDVIPPVARCRNATITLDASGNATLAASQINNSSSGGVAFFQLSQESFTCSDLGTNTVMLTVFDNAGNNDNCTATVTVVDTIDPVNVTCPENIAMEGCTDTVVTYDIPTFSDNTDGNCSLTIERIEGFASGALFPADQTTTVTYRATDASGNTAECSFDVTIEDTEAPTVTCPDNISMGISSTQTSAVVNYNLPTFTDNCSAIANISINQIAGLASGSAFPIGETTNTFEVEDEFGNINQCSFTVTVAIVPTETTVDLTDGTLTITDVNGGTSDDDISFSSDGTTLTISNLTSPVEVAGGPVSTDATTVTIPLASITAGISFEALGGTNGITFSNDLTLTGASNNITINEITNYTQSGAIDIGGIFTIANSANADIVFDSLTATGLSITGVNSIDDANNRDIEIDGDTSLQSTGTLAIDKTTNGSNRFNGLVNLEGSQITFIAQGTQTTFGTVTSTDGTAGVENFLRIRSGAINFTGAVQTAGASELALQSFSNMTQSSSSSITTEVLTLSKSANFTAGSNDIKLLESAENIDLGFVFLTDINDIEIGRLSTGQFNITANTIFISSNTEITKIGSGTSNFNGNIDVTSTSATSSAIINHNAGTIAFTGTDVNLIGRLEYNGAVGTITNLTGDTIGLPFGGPGVSMTFGFLNVEGNIFIGDTYYTILNEATFSGANTLLRGIGTLGGTTTLETDAILQPGGGTETYSITTGNLEINGASFAPLIESNSSRDILEVVGTVTLTNATFSPVGGFTAAPTTDEIVLIDNDDTDAVIGTFLNYPEGSAVIVSGYGFTITYTGGDGNDIALVPDTQNPTAICQDITVTVTPTLDATVNASDIDDGSSDNTGIDQLLIEGSASISFTFADIGSYDVTLTVTDANNNSAQCTATINVVSGINNTLPVRINEYQPTLSGVTDQTIEILGTPGETFAGYVVVVEGDVDSASVGVVRSAELVSGTFDSNGLFTATIPLIITPSHTVILTNSFTGTVNVTDIDPNDNESRPADNLVDFGQIYDAIGIVDEDLDVGNTYGVELGGVDVANISNLARLAFRDALTGDLYVTDNSGNVYDTAATIIASSAFNTDPTAGTTFGTLNPFILPDETTVDVTNGTLTITDVNGGTSDDDITLSSDGTTVTISNLTGTVAVSGGPTLSDATTVTIPIASITNGIIFNAEGGTNGINFATALALTGVDNDITLNGITNYTQASSIDIGGVFTIANSPNADIVFDALTATGLSVTNVNSIADNTIGSTSIFRIEGDTTLQATNTIVIDDANDDANNGNNVSFAGNVTLEGSRITFVARGTSTLFQDITTTDPTLGVNTIRINSGRLNLYGNIQTAGVSQLYLSGFSSITQFDNATITTDVLSLGGRNNGSTHAILDGNNDTRLLETFDTNSLREVTYNDINDVIIGTLTAEEFDIKANSGTIFLTEETILTKTGTDISYFSGDIEVNSNATSPVINHNAGTITCTGLNMSLFGNLTYNGLAGTTTEFLSTDTDLSTTDITLGGSTANLTFGNLNVTGVFFAIPQTSISIEAATFTGASTALQGFSTSTITGGPITITNGAVLQPGNSQTTSSLITDDIIIDGGSFAPHINSGTDYSFMTIQGTLTLTNATFTPVGDFVTLPSNSNELILLDNDGTDAIVGTFLNHPEGSSIEVDGVPFTISYVGGDGNDFSLVKNNESPFITTWQTTTANESITIPTFSDETYDYIIDWGDGSIAYGVTGDASHTYTTAGTYTVSIFGTFPRIFFDGSTSNNAEKLLTVEQWGDNPWTSMEGAFHRCANLTITNANIDIPDLSNVISFVEIFDGCISFNSDISNWDVSNVEDFSEAFEDCDIFNQPLNSWDMSSAQSISYMFYEAFAFNQPLNNWNVSNVTNMEGVFASASVFNQDLNSWNVSNVTSMYEMFDTANAFNGNISSWNVANVQNMEDLFQDNLVFNQNISGWNVSSVEDMTAMFSGAEAFNQDISGWNVGAVTQMNDMFQNAILFNQDIGNWNVSSVTNMYEMFDGADSFDQNLGNWDIGNIMDTGFSNSGLRGMFGSGPGGVAMSVANYDATLIGWNTDNSGIAGDGIDDIPQNLIFGGGKNQYCTSEADQLNLINTHGWSISDDGQASDCGILIAPKVYLQGATLNPNTGEETLMRDDLRVNGLLSTTSPYADSATCEATVFDTTGADAIVDWIWIELRDATDNTSAFASQSALLQRDGDVVSVDGSTAVEFNVESRNYYVVIKHRNHLGIMSASSIALSATETIVDFRDGSTVTFGSNAQTSFGMPSGVVGMWAGNVNDDTLVQYSGTSPDTPNILSLVLNDPGNFLNFPTFAVSGYDNNDVNMDGSTQYSGTNPDSPVILQNVLAHPGNFLNFSTYQIIEQLPQD